MPNNIREMAFTAGTAFVVVAFGPWSPTLNGLLIFMSMDYITGYLAARHHNRVSSKVGFKGIAKKILMLALVALGHQLDVIMGTLVVRDACIAFYLANEAVSILENATEMGVPLPPQLVDTIHFLRGNSEKKEEQ